MAKYLAGRQRFSVQILQLSFTAIGYIEEYKVQKFYRDAKILELYEGTKEAEIMTLGKSFCRVSVSTGGQFFSGAPSGRSRRLLQ